MPDASQAANPAVGVLIFVLGGLAGAIFYLPFKRVKQWAWESYWLIYAVVGLVVVPWALTLTTSPNALAVLKNAPSDELLRCYLFGAMWGVGGLTWGLMIRYLGVGLGLAIGCGLCSAGGTLIQPILAGQISTLYGTPDANMALVAVGVSIFGIVLVGLAGMSKEGELPAEEKKKAVAEYDFKKGILVAIFSGLMSGGLGVGLQSGKTIELKANYGSQSQVVLNASAKPADFKAPNATNEGSAWIAPAPADEKTSSKTWRGMPVLVVALLGGFTVNFLWCLYLNAKNKTFGDYARSGAPLATNLIFAGLAGLIWCSQFIAFKTGEPAMGQRGYIGWAVLMASSILFSAILGVLLGEWRGTSARTRGLLAAGLLLLLGSSFVAGYAGSLKQGAPPPKAPSAEARFEQPSFAG